jgi:hypothetical protein
VEDETYERWRERCLEKEKSFIITATKFIKDSPQVSILMPFTAAKSSAKLLKTMRCK